MSTYFTVKGLKVRVSDHEPNFSMDKFRGRNDIELYTRSADNQKLDIEAQIERFLDTPLALEKGITKKDFDKVLGKKTTKEQVLIREYKIIDSWFANPHENKDLINDLTTNPNWFVPTKLNASQRKKWLEYLEYKIKSL